MASITVLAILFLVSTLHAIESDNTTAVSDATTASTSLEPISVPTTDSKTEPITETTTLTSTVVPKSTSEPNEIPKFAVKDNSVTCILFQGIVDLSINYNFNKEILTKKFNVGSDATPSGSCGELKQVLVLSWLPAEGAPFILNIEFQKLPPVPSAQDIVVDSIVLNYTLSEKVFPGTTDNGSRVVRADGEFFKMPASSSYTCLAPQVINLNGTNAPIANFTISSLRVEAFRNSTSEDFIGSSYDCVTTPATSNVIPIAVGVSFAILIVLAIIAFLIGNRRRQQGYQNI